MMRLSPGRLSPRQALIAACLVSGLLTAACASVAPSYVDQAALTPASIVAVQANAPVSK